VGPHPKRKIITLPRASAPPAPIAQATKPPSPNKPEPQPAADASPAARTQRDLSRAQAVQWLGQNYPNVFGPEVKLLAIRVGRQLWPIAKAFGGKRRALNDALQWRTTLGSYLTALAAEGATRCDLDGKAVEPVSPAHRQRAIEMKAVRLRIRREYAQPRKGSRP
jgi:hypothetical protein